MSHPNHVHVMVTAETRGICDTCGAITRPGVICTTGKCSRRQCDACGAKGYIAVPVLAPRPVRDFDERRDHEQSERAAMQRWKFDGFDPSGRY